MLVENAKGNFAFVRGIPPFSSGVVARPGFEIVHATFKPFVPLAQGYELVDRHLHDLHRPIHALCGMELRLPKAVTSQGFEEFNRPYIEKLKSWELQVDGLNPVTRTNVALEVNPVAEPSLAGFFYTTPADGNVRTFNLAGSADSKAGPSGAEIVARGDTSPAGMKAKAECVIEILSGRLAELGAGWDDASAVNLYTVYDAYSIIAATLLPAMRNGARNGITWHFARPPVIGLDLEIDARRVRQELVIAA